MSPREIPGCGDAGVAGSGSRGSPRLRGNCTVMLDGNAVKSRTMFAVQADGRQP
jgi:aerobic-type carbon monoxide dehydrogenase small subunit (CoxS/CutS family)